jgi:hypothetical protein
MSVYLLHYDRPIGDIDSRFGYAQHYTGSSPDLARRLAEHERDSDVKIMAAVRKAGIGWTLARTWEGGRVRERQIKIQGGASRHCPVCKGHEPRLDAPGSQPYHAPGRAPAAESPTPIARWTRPPEPEPEPLENFIVARLEPAEAAALTDALNEGQRAAWQHTAPGPDYEARFETACEVARISGQEARAAQRMAEAREVAAVEDAAYREAAWLAAGRQLQAQARKEERAGPTWPGRIADRNGAEMTGRQWAAPRREPEMELEAG